MNLGAGAYLGFSQTVKAGFAAGKATDTWSTLLQTDNNTVGDIPGHRYGARYEYAPRLL